MVLQRWAYNAGVSAQHVYLVKKSVPSLMTHVTVYNFFIEILILVCVSVYMCGYKISDIQDIRSVVS